MSKASDMAADKRAEATEKRASLLTHELTCTHSDVDRDSENKAILRQNVVLVSTDPGEKVKVTLTLSSSVREDFFFRVGDHYAISEMRDSGK